MNLAMRLTLDGLIRALRMRAQTLAEHVEFPGLREAADDNIVAGEGGRSRRTAAGGGDDDSGRG